MPSIQHLALKARDDFDYDFYDPYYDYDVPWWYTKTGVIVKYSIIGFILLCLILYLIGGFLHARSRLKRGLQPLPYHRFLVGRRAQTYPQQTWVPQNNPAPDSYYMNNMPPPPVYDPTRPPMYQPPEGGSKVDPSQWGPEQHQTRQPGAMSPAPDYQPPAGPPPAMR